MPTTQSYRTLILSRHPRNHVTRPPDAMLICPGDIAARQLNASPLSLDEVAQKICESHGITIAPEHTTLRALTAALREFSTAQDPGGIARMMLSSVNMLYREGVDLADLVQRTTGRIHQVARAAHETRLRLRSDFLVSKSDAIAAATNLVRRPRSRTIIVYGFARLIAAEYRLLDTIAGPKSKIYLPHSPNSALFNDATRASEYLESRGWIVETAEDEARTVGQLAAEAFLGSAMPVKGLRARSCPTAEDEVRSTLREIKLAISQRIYGPEDVAIVARSESAYGDLVRETAWEYQLPVRTHYSISLLDTRLGQWLSGLLEVCEPAEFPFEATARLALHSLGANLKQNQWTDDEWSTARKDHTRGASAWNDRHLDIEVLNWPPEQKRTAWCAQLLKLLETLQIRNRSLYRPQDIAACEGLYNGLRELSVPLSGDTENLTRQEFAVQLRELMRVTAVPSDLSRAGIDVHTPLSLYGAEIKHLYVLGAAEGKLPMPVSDDALIDFHERILLHRNGLVELESAAGAARRETLSFYSLLLAARESITFSYTRIDGSVEVKSSPYLTRMGVSIEREELFTGIAAGTAELLHYQIGAHRDAPTLFVERARQARDVVQNRENGVHDSYTGQIDVPLDYLELVFSPAQINTFGQCSYRWYAQKLLGLADPEEAEDDLANNLKGILYHETLSRGLEACKDEPDIRLAMSARLEQDFDDAAAHMPALARLPGWKGRRPELLKQLQSAIDSPKFLLEGSQVIYTERSFEGEWHGLRVRGRLDRLDKWNGNPIVIDYKTSGSRPKGAKDEDGGLKLDVQLPIYMSAGCQSLAHGRIASGGYYLSLTTGEHLGEYGMGFSKAQKSPDVAALAALADLVKVRLNSGSYPVDPDIDQKACEYCELDLICRRGPHLTRLAQGIGQEDEG